MKIEIVTTRYRDNINPFPGLMVDWRTFSAARIAHVSPATVKRE